MFRNVSILGAMALAVALPLGSAWAEADPALLGAWIGTAVQTYPDGMVDEMLANVVFLADGTGTTEYPTFACSGTLAPVAGKAPGVFIETITVNAENCATGGTFTFTLADDGLHFDWAGTKFGVAAGVLQRVATIK